MQLTRTVGYAFSDFVKEESPFANQDIEWQKYVTLSLNYSITCPAPALNSRYLMATKTCIDSLVKKDMVWVNHHPYANRYCT